ncbi:hypothetical protein OQA88_11409 [Cercophora sp. LCS_1]
MSSSADTSSSSIGHGAVTTEPTASPLANHNAANAGAGNNERTLGNNGNLRVAGPAASASQASSSVAQTSDVSQSGGMPGTGAGAGAGVGETPQNGDGDGNAAKKRKTGPGSRGVANLTPEQLAKKRANDREAQRAIRERQRLRNEYYEREIRELKSQRPYQELQAALQQTAAVQAEMDSIKRVLASIVATIEPILGRSAVGQPPTQPPADFPSLRPLPQQPQPLNAGSTPASIASPGSGHWHSPATTTTAIDAQQDQHPVHAIQQHDVPQGLEIGPERLGLDFVLDPTQKLTVAKIQSGINGAQDSPQYSHVPMKHDWTGTPAAVATTPTSATTTTATTTTYPSSSTSSSRPRQHPPHPLPQPTQPPVDLTHATTPFKNSQPTCPLDSLLLDFLSERRQRAAEGLPTAEIIGPRYPSVSSLLNPAVSRFSHPLSKVFTDILACFPFIAALPERVAVLYIMFLIMRWQVLPTPENYSRLPEWVRATPSQLERPHPAWMDHIPFPQMREQLICGYEPGGFPFENFFIPWTSTLRVNWPYEDVDVLLRSPIGGNGEEEEELVINPVFERHLRRLENWTLGDVFNDAFPGLGGTYNLKSERGGGGIVFAGVGGDV